MKQRVLESRIDKIHRVNFLAIDKVGFGGIFLLWIGFVILCGLIYFFFSSDSAYLLSMMTKTRVDSLLNSLYFSVVASTTTGFGDIVPMGIFKIISSIEVIVSLLVVAVVTSKFISLKQNVILEELYEITFSERINRMRSSMLVFRHNINGVIHKVEDGTVKKREIDQLYVLVATFKETIYEINSLFSKKHKEFVKQMNGVDISLMANSMVHSFHRFRILLKLLEADGREWRHKKLTFFLDKALHAEEEYFRHVRDTGLLSSEDYKNLVVERDKVISKLKPYLDDSNNKKV